MGVFGIWCLGKSRHCQTLKTKHQIPSHGADFKLNKIAERVIGTEKCRFRSGSRNQVTVSFNDIHIRQFTGYPVVEQFFAVGCNQLILTRLAGFITGVLGQVLVGLCKIL